MTRLEKSDDFRRKMDFIKQKDVPMQTEIELRLGTDLSSRVFETKDPALHALIGTKPPLSGPPDEMWISPSDLLINYVRLTPPLTSKHIQALTHKGILEIGEVVEKTFMAKMEARKILALKSNTERLKFIAQRDIKKAIHRTIRQQEKIFAARLVLIYEEFQQQLQDALDKQKEELIIEKEMEVLKGKLQVKSIMQKKVEEVIKVTVTKLVEEYAIVLEQQSQKWHDHFKYHLGKAQEHLEQTLQIEGDKCEERLRDQFTDLQCEFIANIMYAVCAERKRCQTEKEFIELKHTEKLKSVKEELLEAKKQLAQVSKESEEKNKEIHGREEVLFEILKEFQKFVYFAVKAEPQQAEYLLDIERLMIFELTKTVMERQPELFKGNSLWDLTRRSSTISSTFPCLSLSEESMETADLLVAKDYHNCDNKERVDTSAHTLTSSEDLPAFVYGRQIFVREDFRNMLSQGLKISKSNEHWNWDVDDLEKLLTKDHGVCLKDSDITKFPCLDDICPTICPQDFKPEKPSKRTFYETCLGPCEKEEYKIPKIDEAVCDMTCIKELVNMPCNFDCLMSPSTSDIKMKVDKGWSSESKLQEQEKSVVTRTCKSCQLFRQGPEPAIKGVEVVCDCYPKVDPPSLTKIKEITAAVVLDLHKKDSELDLSLLKPTVFKLPSALENAKKVPLHFAKNSQMLLRQKSLQKKLAIDDYEKKAMKMKKTVETHVKVALERSDLKRIRHFDRSHEKLLSTKDSVILTKSTSMLFKGTLKEKKSLDTLSGATSLEKFGSYLNQLQNTEMTNNVLAKKTVKISHFQVIPDHDHEKVSFGELPKIIPRRWSTPHESITKIVSSNLGCHSDLGPHVDERIGNFVKNFCSDQSLRQMFLGTR